MGLLGKIFGATPKQQPVHVTDDNFHDEVIQSEVPVVVDFWGEQCAPCQKLEPVIMTLAGKYDGRVKVCEAPVRQTIKMARRYKVMSTPTVLYFKPNGVLAERVSGFRGRLYHEEIIENELLPDREDEGRA